MEGPREACFEDSTFERTLSEARIAPTPVHDSAPRRLPG